MSCRHKTSNHQTNPPIFKFHLQQAADPESLRPDALRCKSAPEAAEAPGSRRTGLGGPIGPGGPSEGRFRSFALQSQGVENKGKIRGRRMWEIVGAFPSWVPKKNGKTLDFFS